MDNEPIIFSYNDGSIHLKLYRVGDLMYLHRLAGPAKTIYYTTGQVGTEEYFVNGLRHREEGPAIIDYTISGIVKYKAYHLSGLAVPVFSDEELKRFVKLMAFK